MVQKSAAQFRTLGVLTVHFYILIIALSSLSFGCASELELSPEYSSEKSTSHDLVRQLAGQWDVHAVVTSDCHGAQQVPFPDGVRTWVDTGDALSIESDAFGADGLALYAMDTHTLQRQRFLDMDGCSVTETWTLMVVRVRDTQATGRFEARLEMKGDGCDPIDGQMAQRRSCLTTSDWAATRVAPDTI